MTTLIPKYSKVTTANRTIAEKFGENISVKDFGAVGDGTTDDTAAIQAAINSITIGTIFFPEGTYKITNTITITSPKKISLYGAGGRVSVLQWAGADNKTMLFLDGALTGASNFSSIQFLGFENTNFTVETNLHGNRAIDIGVNPSGSGVSNVTIHKCLFSYFEIGISIGSESDHITITECWFFVWTVFAIKEWGASVGLRIIGNQLQGGQNASVAISLLSSVITILNNTIQNVTSGAGILLTGCGSFSITDNYTESISGAYFVKMVGGFVGEVARNQIGGYVGADLISMDATSHDVTIGDQYYVKSGGDVASIIKIVAGAANVKVIGDLYCPLGAPPVQISGTPSINIINGAISATGAIRGQTITSVVDLANVAGASNATMFTAIAGAMYIVNAAQGAENYTATTIVKSGDTAVTAELIDLGFTNANLTITNTGLAIKVNNGIGGVRSISYTILRLI